MGRVEDLQNGKLDDLIRSLAKFSEKLSVVSAAEDLFADWSKEYGPSVVFRRLWENLGLHQIIAGLLSDREISIDIQEAVFCMVLNRLTEPTSKLGVNDWKDSVYRPQFDALQLQHFYKAIDFLDENKDAIEEKLFYRHTDLFSSQLDLVFFDTTSSYVEGEAGAFDLLQYGHSKDHRPDRLQVMIGILMSRDGMPIAHQIFPGNTPDTEAFMEAIKDLKYRFNIQRVIVVGDRGMMGKRTLELLEELGLQYILGVRMRNIKSAPEIIQDPTPFEIVEKKDNLKVKEVAINGNRYVVCLNEEEAKRDKAVREQVADKLRERLKSGNIKDLIGNSEYRRYIKADDTNASIDEKKLEQAALFDGLYILQTNTTLPTTEVATAYRDLWQIERAFRNLKSTLDLRPMYHWTERRISGHITLCFLALVMQIKFQKLLEESNSEYGYTEVIRVLRKVHIVKLGFKDQEHLVRTEVHGAAAMAFKAVGVRVPERVQTVPLQFPKKGNCSGTLNFKLKRSFIHEGFRIWGVKLQSRKS
ncbi:IS1634 family transposase [Paradesulfitobacterium aromaticivorans]